jgi:hypothetical protein
VIDFNKLMTDELNERRKGNMFRPQGGQPQAQSPEENVPTIAEVQAMKNTLPPEGSSAANPKHITIEETDLNETYGPQQVQSLLGLALDFSLRKKLSDAEDDVDAVRHLNRIKNRGG